MKALRETNLWQWSLVVGGTLLLAFTAAADEAKVDAKSEDATEYNNWITLGVGSPFIGGDREAFMRRRQMNRSVFGGVEDFHWEQNVGKSGLFELNGHGIYDENNYGVDLKLADPERGYIRAGYEQFRTWYDDGGGFYPGGTTNWFQLPGDPLAVDRGHAWFEAGLTLPDIPQIIFRYDHEFRDGTKDSTIWGDSNFTGPPTPLGTSRNFVPAFLGIDERRDSFSLKLKHTIGNTAFEVGGSYQHLENDNTRNIERRPGEPAANRYVTERELLDEDVFNAHAMSETRINDKVKVTVGGAFTRLETDVGGSRIYGSSFSTLLPTSAFPRQARDSGYFGIIGGGEVDQYVGNLNLMYSPTKNLVIVPSLRIEKEDVTGFARYFPTTTGASAPFAFTTNALTINTADRDLLEVTEAIEARYSGFKNWSLYARAELSQACEDRSESITTAATTFYSSEWERFGQKYTAGANWFVMPRLNMGGQYYYKSSDNTWTSVGTKDTRLYETHDLNYRLTWRPLSRLSFVTRYDFQIATVQHQSGTLPEVESGSMTLHVISESINWTPTDRMYVQLNGSYAWDGAVQVPLEGAPVFGNTNFAPNLKNGYWTANATLGYALDEVSDLTLQYTYYYSDNYVNNYLWSQPFGASGEEHGITATVSRQLNKRTKVSLKYGYFHSQDDTSGGRNDFAAHLIYATMQYRF